MRRWAIARLVGGMLSLVVTATGYALDLSQVMNIGEKWWWLITLIIGIFLLSWVILDFHNQLNRLLNAKPSITVRPIKDNDDYYLEVNNTGEPAEFECQIRITEDKTGYKKGQIYFGYWELGASSKATIMNIDRLKIAHRETVIYPLDSKPLFPYLMLLRLYYGSSTGQNFWTSTSWSSTVNNSIVKPRKPLNKPTNYF
jgi:hypothetical protein